MGNGFEEYVGYWVSHWEWNSSGSFRVFIDNRVSLNDGTEVIGGRIKDRNGRARFGGEFSDSRVKFAKFYEPEHSDTDAAKGEITYEGKLSRVVNHGRRHYEGKYTARDCSGKVVGEGRFVLEKYAPTRTLEFLMRWEHMRKLNYRRELH